MKQYLIPVIYLTTLLFTSCSPITTKTPEEVLPTISTNTPIIIFSPTPHYPPTIEASLQNQFYELLANNGNCNLPCVWGVTPGITSLNNAMSIIGKYTLVPKFSPYKISGIEPRYEYSNVVDVSEKIDIHTYIKIDSAGDKVRGVSLSFSLSEGGYSAFADENFKIYSISELFKKYGIPDYIYLDPPRLSEVMTAYSIDVFYEKEKIMLSYSGNSTEVGADLYKLCPNIGDGNIGGLHLVTADTNDPLIHIIPYGRDGFSLEPTALTSRELKLNPRDLFNLFIHKGIYCFTYDRNLLKVAYPF